MNICLVKTPSLFLMDDYAFPPLGLLAVATVLKQSGHEVTVWDKPLDYLPRSFSYYGFGPTIPEYPSAVSMLKILKVGNPKVHVVIGGPFATIASKRCLEDGFDTVVIGDGEFVAEKAFSGKIQYCESKEENINIYPIINRGFIDIHKYQYEVDGTLATTIVSSKGCPFSCAFCSKVYKTLRLRDAWHVIKELDYIHYVLGFNACVFMDDLFIVNHSRTIEIASHLYQLNMKWRCMVRADLIVKYGEYFAKTLQNCGCTDVGMGIESGSDVILQNVNKQQNVVTIRKAVKILQDANIRIKGFFIIGLPGENYNTIQETDKLLEECRFDDVDIKVFCPYEGTPIWNNPENYDCFWGKELDETRFYKGHIGEYSGTVRTSCLTNAQIFEAQLMLEQKYKRWNV